MNHCYILIVFSLLNLSFSNNLQALSPEQCSKTGGNCICIAFPGSKAACTRSKQASLIAESKEGEFWSSLYKKISQI